MSRQVCLPPPPPPPPPRNTTLVKKVLRGLANSYYTGNYYIKSETVKKRR